uniref:Uncharacterized protein n=1 Tax=viral metagenome TaxID=1070528 RepID=A0A6M3J7H4_9ZZZZ
MTEPIDLAAWKRELRGTELTCRSATYDETRPGQMALALIAAIEQKDAALRGVRDCGHKHKCRVCIHAIDAALAITEGGKP